MSAPAEIPAQTCLKCGKESDTKIVCDVCRVELTPSQRQKLDHIFQEKVIELFGNSCVDCDKSAETKSGELCADHLDTKGASPESRYDLAAAVCRCSECHTKRHTGEIEKVPQRQERMPRQTQEKAKKSKKSKCSYFGCNLMPISTSKKGRCIRHMWL